MERYFNGEHSIAAFSDGKIENVLEAIASRYMGANPAHDYIARPFIKDAIVRNKNYRYEADFAKIFPSAALGSYVYAWGKYEAADAGSLKMSLIPYGPVKIWMNEEEVFHTTVESERYDNEAVSVNLPLKKGWNNLVLRFTRTAAGFGAEWGTWLGKLCYYFFRGADVRIDSSYLPPEEMTPSLLIEGFDITSPFSHSLSDSILKNLRLHCERFPAWTEEEKGRGVFGRIFPNAAVKDKALARTQVFLPVPAVVGFSGFQSGNCSLYAGNKVLKNFTTAGDFEFEEKLEAGNINIAVVSSRPEEGAWDFSLAAEYSGRKLSFTNPYLGDETLPWIYAGPFKKTKIEELVNTHEADRERLVGGEGEKTFWRFDMPDTWVRLYNENPLYGHWNYPLGVTLYGLIETARYFESSGKAAIGKAIGQYAESHVSKSVRSLEYALFDKEHFGGATAVHHLLTSLDSLDDCGSFGSLVLELAKDRRLGDYALAVNLTGDHILKTQDRREEGCFWRREMMHHFHNGTLWADDLYMSVPFLCRYSAYKKDPAILDIAAMQFEGFRKYLFLEDKKLMAHVYDFRRNMNTGIPWGRGNGWSIFSLTELLMVLPSDHPKRESLLGFFRTLAEGFLACQDESGMWHQVLDMPSSYIETSCTAMFICAFSRGIRYNWFNTDTTAYSIAAEKAWQALEKYSIDSDANIHGVCRGSEFAFNPRYYAEHLLPRLNDTHGIGIVLLAGVELLKLREWRLTTAG